MMALAMGMGIPPGKSVPQGAGKAKRSRRIARKAAPESTVQPPPCDVTVSPGLGLAEEPGTDVRELTVENARSNDAALVSEPVRATPAPDTGGGAAPPTPQETDLLPLLCERAQGEEGGSVASSEAYSPARIIPEGDHIADRELASLPEPPAHLPAKTAVTEYARPHPQLPLPSGVDRHRHTAVQGSQHVQSAFLGLLGPVSAVANGVRDAVEASRVTERPNIQWRLGPSLPRTWELVVDECRRRYSFTE